MIPEKFQTGQSEFIFVGEHPAIDFANTFLKVNGEETDCLRSWTDVADWLSLAGLAIDLGLKSPGNRGTEALETLVALRKAWIAELARLVSGGKVSDEFLARINRLLASNTFPEQLRPTGDKGFHLVRSFPPLRGAKLVQAVIVRQIALFLAEANLNYLHQCANTTSCVLYFYDTTKNHRRQWCSVATCGNRHKVAEFRKRQVEANA